MPIPSENECSVITSTSSSALRVSTTSSTASLTPSCCSMIRWLPRMKTTPVSMPHATPYRGEPGRSSPSLSSATLAAVIMPAAIALPTPSHHSDTFLYQTIGSAPSPVESAVTQPYHHTCAALRPLTNTPPGTSDMLTHVTMTNKLVMRSCNLIGRAETTAGATAAHAAVSFVVVDSLIDELL